MNWYWGPYSTFKISSFWFFGNLYIQSINLCSLFIVFLIAQIPLWWGRIEIFIFWYEKGLIVSWTLCLIPRIFFRPSLSYYEEQLNPILTTWQSGRVFKVTVYEVLASKAIINSFRLKLNEVTYSVCHFQSFPCFMSPQFLLYLFYLV